MIARDRKQLCDTYNYYFIVAVIAGTNAKHVPVEINQKVSCFACFAACRETLSTGEGTKGSYLYRRFQYSTAHMPDPTTFSVTHIYTHARTHEHPQTHTTKSRTSTYSHMYTQSNSCWCARTLAHRTCVHLRVRTNV